MTVPLPRGKTNGMPQRKLSRRRLLEHAGQSVALIPLLSLTQTSAWAAEKISEQHAIALALGYVHDGTKTDTARFPKRAGPEGAGQFCYNCSQYKEAEPVWGTCAIFPDLLVAKNGWCNVWVPIT